MVGTSNLSVPGMAMDFQFSCWNPGVVMLVCPLSASVFTGNI